MIQAILILAVLVYYLIYTMRYFLVLRKSVIFTGRVKRLHMALIWIIPFFWILLLKNLTKPMPGSYQVKDKTIPKPFSDNNDDAATAAMMDH